MISEPGFSGCKVELVSSRRAGAFLKEEDIDNPFLEPALLDNVCEPVDWWLASWRGNPICLWPICGNGERDHRPPSLLSYIGPVISPKINIRPVHRRYRIAHVTITALLQRLTSEYHAFTSSIHPDLTDVRPLLWFADQCSGSLSLTPRYTAVLDLTRETCKDALIRVFSRNRRRDVRSLARSGEPEIAKSTPSELYQLYRNQLADKHADKAADSRRNIISQVLAVAANGDGFVFQYRIGVESLSGFICCLTTSHSASAVLMATTKTGKSNGLPAWMILAAVTESCRLGLDRFDFAGANSPVGAVEKHSFGAYDQLYFNVRFNTKKTD